MRTRFDAMIEKRSALEQADANGEVADSMAVRLKLVENSRQLNATPRKPEN
jgi:hypothetical protein